MNKAMHNACLHETYNLVRKHLQPNNHSQVCQCQDTTRMTVTVSNTQGALVRKLEANKDKLFSKKKIGVSPEEAATELNLMKEWRSMFQAEETSGVEEGWTSSAEAEQAEQTRQAVHSERKGTERVVRTRSCSRLCRTEGVFFTLTSLGNTSSKMTLSCKTIFLLQCGQRRSGWVGAGHLDGVISEEMPAVATRRVNWTEMVTVRWRLMDGSRNTEVVIPEYWCQTWIHSIGMCPVGKVVERKIVIWGDY